MIIDQKLDSLLLSYNDIIMNIIILKEHAEKQMTKWLCVPGL